MESEVRYRYNICPPFVSVLTQIKLVNAPPPFPNLEIHFNIILPSTPVRNSAPYEYVPHAQPISSSIIWSPE